MKLVLNRIKPARRQQLPDRYRDDAALLVSSGKKTRFSAQPAARHRAHAPLA